MGSSAEWSARTSRQEDRLPLRGSACIVEPDENERRRIAAIVRRMGFTAHETAHGAAAAFVARSVTLELILVNVLMPDALRLIRQWRRALPELRIIALAPGAPSDPPIYLELARFAGADAALGAPVLPGVLCAAISAPRRATRMPAQRSMERPFHLTQC